MTLGDFIEAAKTRLSGMYDQRELQNILCLVIEEKLGLKKFEWPAKRKEILAQHQAKELELIIKRLAKNEPVQYILGEADFYGLKFKVGQHVLIPRPETEELVDLVIKEHKEAHHLHILDIGSGSGCIAIALKKNLREAAITAIDISKDALTVAKENALLNEMDVDFLWVDFLETGSWNGLGKYDVIVSNPPYITRQEFVHLDSKVREYEPEAALIAKEDDPFIFYRQIAAFGLDHLADNGSIFVELNSKQAHLITRIFQEKGYQSLTVKEDMQELPRILKIRK